MSSPVLGFVLKNRFGGMTIFVNGRMTTPPDGDVRRVPPIINLRDANNRGQSVWGWLVHRVALRVERALPATSRMARWLRAHG
jgi:hypothetical protein